MSIPVRQIMKHTTKTVYKFGSARYKIWEKLIKKYYGDEIWLKVKWDRSTDIYEVKTGKIWSGVSSIIALPNVNEYPIPKNSEFVHPSIMVQVDNVIEERLKACSFIGSYYESSKFISKVKTIDVLYQLKMKQYISHWYYSPSQNMTLIIICGIFPFLITSEQCWEASLASLDLNNGFSEKWLSFPEWKEDFSIWKEKFDKDPEKHWDDMIISVKICK